MRLDILEASEMSGLRQSPGCSLVKNPLAMWEPQVQSLGLKDLLEKETATHSSILAWDKWSLAGYGPWGRKKSWTQLRD